MSAHHLFARGVKLTSTHLQNGGNGESIQMPRWGIGLLVLTVLVYLALTFAISYTYGAVVAALTIVESPQTDVYVPVDTLDDDSTPKDSNKPLLEPELVALKPQPITSKIRTTILHLRARAGYWSRFRGLSLYICYYIFRSIFVSLFTMSTITHNPIGRFIACVLAEVMLCRWLLTWVHIVISEPSEKKWWKRLPSFKSKAWKKIAPAATLASVAGQLSALFPAILATVGPIGRLREPAVTPNDNAVLYVLLQSAGLLLLTVVLIVLIDIPAQVTVIRVAASMLPDEDESIVPFDRTFGGKVTPEIVGGSGKLGMLEAWKSFTWPSRIRLLKLAVKVLAFQIAITIMFMMIYIGELRLIMGEDMNKMFKTIADELNGN